MCSVLDQHVVLHKGHSIQSLTPKHFETHFLQKVCPHMFKVVTTIVLKSLKQIEHSVVLSIIVLNLICSSSLTGHLSILYFLNSLLISLARVLHVQLHGKQYFT
jgi:hypothetical protein